jgi:hypothetical protein
MTNALQVRNGRRLVVSYPVGGNRNVLKVRDGKILRKGKSANGQYILMQYTDKGRNRIATLSAVKMINPVIFTKIS